MSDSNPTPPAHDGMAAFEVNGELRLVRTHVTKEIWLASVFSYLGGFLIAVYAMRKVRVTGRIQNTTTVRCFLRQEEMALIASRFSSLI